MKTGSGAVDGYRNKGLLQPVRGLSSKAQGSGLQVIRGNLGYALGLA